MLDIRLAQNIIENALHDTILFALGFRLPSVSTIAALRAVVTQGQTGTVRSDDDLIAVVSSSTTSFRWSTVSMAADDGVSVIKPNDVTANGRWLAWTSPLRFSTVVGANSVTLDQITSGPVQRVILLDKDMTHEEATNLLVASVPAVVIVAESDEPEETTLNAGSIWQTSYNFTITVVCENLRDKREAAQGSNVPNDPDPGANQIDGFIKALLSGSLLNAVVDGVQVVWLGRGWNWTSDLAMRRVMRSRQYTVRVSEDFPQAANEFGAIQDLTAQAHLAALAVTPPAQTTVPQTPRVADTQNYLISGIAVGYPLTGLTQAVTAGSALMVGSSVSYAGQNVTFTAFSDTYRDLNPNGTLTLITVPNDAPQPAVTANAMRIGVTRTNGTGVTADVILAETYAPYGNRNDFGAV